MSSNTVRQSGNITPGHLAVWTTNGVLEDGGTAPQPPQTHIAFVEQSGNITPGHVATWVASGVIKDGGSIVSPVDGTYDDVTISSSGTDYKVIGWHPTIQIKKANGTPFLQLFGDGSSTNSLTFQGLQASFPTQISLNPGAVPETATGRPIAEYIVHRTQDQGTNYGRVSYSCLAGPTPTFDGIIQEYGGTVTPADFQIQLGVENPPNTITSYFFLRCYGTNHGSDASEAGSVGFGDGDSVPQNKVHVNMAPPGSAGKNNSHAFLWEGAWNSGSGTGATWWRCYNELTTNNGGSSFVWESNLNGGGWNNHLTLDDTGRLHVKAALNEPLSTLSDIASVTLDASLSTMFKLTATGDRTILAPTNAPASGETQKITIAHVASGGTRTLTLTTGSAGSFRFGTTITGLTITGSGLTDYIDCIWNQTASRWDVVGYVKGF